MITFQEAENIIFSSIQLMGKERIELKDAIDRILGEPVISDDDLPPFNRSAMDGFACKAEDQDLALKIIQEIPAGSYPVKKIGNGQCARIMTGAPIPEGSDIVIRIEDTLMNESGLVEIKVKGQVSNIRQQGEDVKNGETIILPGKKMNKHHIGIMAMIGCVRPIVFKRPSIGIISTGSELVPPENKPGISQIRNSNGSQIMAQVSALGLEGVDHGIVDDEPGQIYKLLKKSIAIHDVILISGGVSVGEYDYVPGILKDIGMDIRMHKMKVRPGKPFLFASKGDTYAFGLPGNPVSTLVQFECLIKPFLEKLMGISQYPYKIPMLMAEDYKHIETALQFFIPVAFSDEGVKPLEYHGSAHLTSYTNADGILEIPAGKTYIHKGEKVYVRPI